MQGERELINTTCANGRIIVTETRIIIKTLHGLNRDQQTIPRSILTGVDCKIKFMTGELTLHRQGGQPVTVKTLTKKAANEIAAMLS